jgi:hypothetical protein
VMRFIRSLLQFLIGASVISIVLMVYKYSGGRLFPKWDAVRLFKLSLFLCFSVVMVAGISGIVHYYRKRIKSDNSGRGGVRKDRK